MFFQTSLEILQQAELGYIAPVVRECPADMLTPVGAASRLFVPGEPAFLLESVVGGEMIGRFSFIGVHPKREIGRDGGSLAELKNFVREHKVADLPGAPILPGSAVGYLSYDAIRLYEDIPDRHADAHPTSDYLLCHFEDLIVFDHLKQRLWLVTLVAADAPRDEATLSAAFARIDALQTKLNGPVPPRDRSVRLGEPSVHPDPETFKANVEKAREYINAGDIFQVVLARNFQRSFSGDPLQVYRALRMINPSPFMFFMDFGDHQLVGASPEDLVRVRDGKVETLPIAGTRKRGRDEAHDQALADELLADPKEQAEHMMLVDLARNDIGRVSKPGSVEVERLMEVERFSHVMHLVSRVSGQMQDTVDEVDALFSCFPAGTVSGAPKIRAMEIIDEMEGSARGVYAGSVCYFDGMGNLDSCITIRTLLIKDGVASMRCGAGIVADSEADLEELETRNKAAAVLAALDAVEELA